MQLGNLDQDQNWLEFQRLIADSNWYASHFNKSVAIRNGQLLGTYNSKSEAIKQSRQSNEEKQPTFIMTVGEENKVVDIPSILEVSRED